MVDAAVSGVLYTLDPRFPEHEVMMISAAWGLGAPIVSGKVKTDLFTVDRKAPHPLVTLDIVLKETELVRINSGGTDLRPVQENLQTKSCLSDEQIRHIAEAGLRIERHFKKPQDIEWAIDRQNKLYILQARPLNIKAQVAEMVCDIASVLETCPVIFANKGMIAAEGIAAGKVFVVRSEEELNDFPQDAILVTPYTSPRLAKVIKKANAIITDVGSPTGHMATIAREFRVPTIVNTEVATQLLHSGQEITVDARQNVVYAGTVKELCYYEFSEEAFEETYEYRLLRRVLKKIAPLNLLDPSDHNFVPEACKTYHDITRFVHEKAVEALIGLEYASLRNTPVVSRKLKFDVPLDLVLIDIGGGIKSSNATGEITPEDVLSVPMSAFLKGLSAPGAWNTDPMSVDLGSFMSSLTRTFSFAVASPRQVGQNLAVLSSEYVNIHLRLGYHFNMIAAYISEIPNDNYAYFRFLGGVTDIARRSRRAQLLSEILAKNDFRVDVRGDLVVARIKKLSHERMLQKMHLLGLLVGFTRQLDIKMTTDQEIKRSIENFNQLKNGSIESNNMH
jgi:pyruvate,water dikinase